MSRTSSFRRAAIGGSLFLLALAALVIAFDRSDDSVDDAPPPSAGQSLVAYDGDGRGAIVARGSKLMGVTADGAVRWTLKLGRDDLLPFATCLRACPEAEVTIARSGSVPPDRADGRRRRIQAPSWRPVAQRPRVRIDRPVLPAPIPARIVTGAAGQPALVLERADAALAGLNYLSALSPDRRTAVIVQRADRGAQQGLLLRRTGDGWRQERRIVVGGHAQSLCLTADGRRLGVVGGGPPRILDLAARDARPAVAQGARAAECNAGLCAIGDGVMATAIVRSGSGGQQTELTIHAGARRSPVVRLTGELPLGLWTSAATGTTAILQDGEIVLVSKTGARRTWPGVAAAVPVGGAKLMTFAASGPATIRSF